MLLVRRRLAPTAKHITCFAVAACLSSMSPIRPASAEGFFSLLFGGTPQAASPQPVQPQPLSSGVPGMSATGPAPAQVLARPGRAVSFCVRLCDGRFFPLYRSTASGEAQLCNALCPASKTAIFWGSEIDNAVTSNGARYSGLENAFAYRKQLVAGCTCNGRDGFGLAQIGANQDPTLRADDVVATPHGRPTFKAASTESGTKLTTSGNAAKIAATAAR